MDNKETEKKELNPEEMDKVAGGTENNGVKPVENSDWNITEASNEDKKKKKKKKKTF